MGTRLPPLVGLRYTKAKFIMAREYNFFVYLLTNYQRSVRYIGVTSNLERRLAEHRRRDRPGFAARYQVDRLVYYEQCPEILAALDREKQLKGWKRAKKDAPVATMNPEWKHLSAGWPGR